VSWTLYFVVAVAAYFIGSLPTGYLAGRLKGIDIRQAGSGNIGATNVFRILGKTAGIVVLVMDALKGFLAVRVAAPWVIARLGGDAALSEASLEYLKIVAGFAAILGHNYTCWLRFKGGKGIATTAGVMLGLAPVALGIVLALWIVVFAISRYVSVASIVAAIFLPVSSWLAGQSLRMIAVTAVIGALAIYKHKSNIQRLLSGTENRVGAKKGSRPS
jgi:acyl phosphate:glycerol-3-phosphate acyltransferase